jgi:hypothetical protein
MIEWVIAGLTTVLVLTTIYYAWQTRQTVQEMRRARKVTILPRLIAGMHPKAAGIGFLRLANVGPGPAIDVRATLTFEPGGAPIEWRYGVLAPGETHDLAPSPKGTEEDSQFYLDELTKRFTHLRVAATYSDALGDPHAVEESVEIREWWSAVQSSKQLVEHHWPEETVKELEKLRKAVEKLVNEASSARRLDRPSRPRDESGEGPG